MNTKKVLIVLLVLFLGFWMFTDPHGFAHSSKSALGGSWTVLTSAFRGIIRVIGQLH